MRLQLIQPDGWPKPKGYANGVLVTDPSRFVFVAGQIAWDENQELVGPGDFATQFERALANVIVVLGEAGGLPMHIVRLTMYTTDKAAYLACQEQIGATYRELMGDHYPAMAMVQVSGLMEDDALIEIEATAALP